MHWFSLCLLLVALSAKAEVFKCSAADGRIRYQETACNFGERQRSLNIELFDAEREARAANRLSEVEKDYWAMKSRKAKAQSDELDLLRKQLEVQTLATRLHAPQPQPQQNYPPQPQYWGYSPPIYSRHVPLVYPITGGFNPPLNNAFNPPLHNPHGMALRPRR